MGLYTHTGCLKNKIKNNGITLIALVITIIVLLILAGISISTLKGENGLFSKVKQGKEKYAISEAKEKIELEITNLQIEKQENGEELTKEDLPKMNNKEIDVRDITNFPVEVIYKNYKFEIDSNFQVTYIGETNETIITYTTEPEGYTNQNKVNILVTISNPKGIKSILKPNETDKILPQGQKNVGIDFEVSKNGHYELKVEDVDGKQTIKDIYIGQIDKLAPLDFTPIVTNSGTSSLTIKANAQDAQADEENVKSGIEKYEYFIKNKSGSQFTKYESNEDTYIFKKLETGVEYSIYVITYDKAGNSNTSEEIYATTKIGPKDIYIDSANGNDETGDGTQESPFSTLNKITETGIIKNGLVYNIHLQDGEYIIPSYYGLIELSNDKEINIFGNKQNTKLILPSDGVGSNAGGGGTDAYSINFYRMIIELEDSTTRVNYWCCANNLTFNNVVFINKMANGIDILYINKKTSKVLLNNCTFLETDFGLRCDMGGIKATNCYGTLKSGYATTDEDWNYQTNYITKTPQVNNETYRIIDQESLWKNVGTGINPDGSQANLGVYGGQYSWED